MADDTQSGGGSGGQSPDDAASGKYCLIEVPNYNKASSADAQLGTYLRLGIVKDPTIAGKAGAPRASGEDLAFKAAIPRPDIGGYDQGIYDEVPAPEPVIFEDDDRERAGAPHFTPIADRKAETEKLHTKGGWRDHTDGNRVTTTRGDKIEVIRGNYKLVVLGRQGDPQDSAYWDCSGGHPREGVINKGEFEDTEVKWVDSGGGRWQLTEKATKGDSYERQRGDAHEYFKGLIKYDETGSEAPTAEKPNPVITEKTWALSISEYKGSSALPIPTMSEETWAGSIQEKKTAGTINSLTEVGAKAETTLAGAVAETTIAGATLEVKVAPLTIELALGGKIELFAGAKETFELAATFELTLGVALEMFFGKKTELHNMHNELKELEASIKAAKVSVSGIQTEVKDTRTHISATENTIAATKLKIAGSRNEISQMHNAIGALILAG